VFEGTQFTEAGLVGTLDYIAPEQIQGAETVTAQADVYSLGVMAFQMLTGKLPFEHTNPGALVMAHLMQPAPDPREYAPDLPDEAAAALMQALSKKPEARFKTAADFVRALC
jgi:eukaryotic-like serine/threonine-protein kinase